MPYGFTGIGSRGRVVRFLNSVSSTSGLVSPRTTDLFLFGLGMGGKWKEPYLTPTHLGGTWVSFSLISKQHSPHPHSMMTGVVTDSKCPRESMIQEVSREIRTVDYLSG